ncbi:hypothetical protein [Paenibacillus protaetiae]|uniref:Uncharacterized protein n=1 Tax=Paenibacillus protaetiae TaxID=2509456 RepID=A0A4P6EYU6_9BACL|nr:hypothetical protein [Paenibacillus protaetiae]QAY67925.1 hypothetical protein ET464_17585 [Paenibacillus protaetiae]
MNRSARIRAAAAAICTILFILLSVSIAYLIKTDKDSSLLSGIISAALLLLGAAIGNGAVWLVRRSRP